MRAVTPARALLDQSPVRRRLLALRCFCCIMVKETLRINNLQMRDRLISCRAAKEDAV